jgi:hypothetical protein
LGKNSAPVRQLSLIHRICGEFLGFGGFAQNKADLFGHFHCFFSFSVKKPQEWVAVLVLSL